MFSLPLKLGWLTFERLRFVVNCRNLSIPSAFSEDVYRLQVRAYVLQVDISNQNTLLDEVIVHFDVLGSSMEDWVPSKVNIAHVVAVEENQILDGDAQILKYPFQPNDFIGGDYRAPVFSFCAR